MAITLDATDESLDVVSSAAVNTDYTVDYLDSAISSSSITGANPLGNEGQITTATTTTLVAAPGSATTTRGVKRLSITNVGTTTQTVDVRKTKAANSRSLWGVISLLAGDSLVWADGMPAPAVCYRGIQKTQATDRNGYGGYLATLMKTGTAADAIGYWYCTSKDAGFPGAWAPGTPGLAGRATDGTVAADFGCLTFVNAATGGMYLTNGNIVGSVANWHMVFDCLWVNSGIVVTTTTAQTINSVAFPARDLTGTVNGVGCMIGLLFTGTATNVAVNNTATVSYTNSAGTAGRTATLIASVGGQIPATALVGTVVWFQMAAGDQGVRSIQSITLGTSLGAGSVSLIVARPVMSVPTVVANIGGYAVLQDQVPGVRLYNGSCLLHCYAASATTATMVSGTFTLMER